MMGPGLASGYEPLAWAGQQKHQQQQQQQQQQKGGIQTSSSKIGPTMLFRGTGS